MGSHEPDQLQRQALDNALVGRFAIFLYPPDVLQMDEADKIEVGTLPVFV